MWKIDCGADIEVRVTTGRLIAMVQVRYDEDLMLQDITLSTAGNTKLSKTQSLLGRMNEGKCQTPCLFALTWFPGGRRCRKI